MNSDLTPREKLFRAADPADDAAFSVALNEYRDSLRAEWDAGKLDPVYCPFDCSGCHDENVCPCENCKSRRDDE